jgi:hypothetical protein
MNLVGRRHELLECLHVEREWRVGCRGKTSMWEWDCGAKERSSQRRLHHTTAAMNAHQFFYYDLDNPGYQDMRTMDELKRLRT